MGKSLIITEKPSVARDIAAVLGGMRDHDGWFEDDDHIITFAVGHLLELPPPEDVNPEWKAWILDVLPMIPEQFSLKPKSGQSERIRTIKKLLARKDVDTVVNACDAGREGELIFREVVQYLGNEKPVKRLWLQSMTPRAIEAGLEDLQPGEAKEFLGQAAECRAWSDWLIGMNATRGITKRLKTRKEGGVWSAGRVQTPTLAILVGRELEVLAHIPRPYWRVEGTFAHAGATYTGVWFDPEFKAGEDEEARDDRIFDEARAAAIVDAVRGAAALAEETRKPSRETAPPLFDLTSLQREGNSRFGWSARRTLSAAQRCYEGHKILTYPRTDSRCLPSDYRATVDNLVKTFAGAKAQRGVVSFGDYAAAAKRLLDNGLTNTKRAFNDAGVSDHHAIIPTGQLPGDRLSGDDRRLYDLVVRRFLGTFHPPAVWERVERVTVASGEHFRTRARSLQDPGWRAVLPKSGEDDDSATLAPLDASQASVRDVAVSAAEAVAQAEETKPPPRITEARLLSLMENAGKQIEDEARAAALDQKGIGTPATRADTIENLIRKGYAVRTGKAVRPTVKGIRLIDFLKRIDADRITKPSLTGDIEFHLAQVERGERTAREFMGEIEDYVRDTVEILKTFEYDILYGHEPPLGACRKCGRPVFENTWNYSCETRKAEKGKEDERCPLVIWKDTSGRYIDRRHATILLEKGETDVIDGFMARDGRLYKGTLWIDDEWKVKVKSMGTDDRASDQAEYDVDPTPLGRCPLDEEHQVVETATQFICESQLKAEELAEKEAAAAGDGKRHKKPKVCGFVLPRTVCKREITRDEALHYLANGKTELLTEFTSRFGRPFSATLVLKETGRHGFEFPPREARAGGGRKKGGGRTSSGRKTTTRKKKPSGKKTTRKVGKKTTRKKRGKTTRKAAARSSGKKASARKTSPRTPKPPTSTES